MKLKLLNFLASRIGAEMDAVITGVEAFGLFVQGLALPAEGLVPLDALPDDIYRYDRASHTLCRAAVPGNSFRLGDRVRVAVARVDVDRRVLNLRLVGRGRGPAAARAPPPGDAKRGRAAVAAREAERGRRSRRHAALVTLEQRRSGSAIPSPDVGPGTSARIRSRR